MSLNVFNIVSRNGDTSFAGSALFNSTRILNNGVTVNTNNTWFEYAKNKNGVIGDKFEIDEAIATFDNIYTAPTGVFKLTPVHNDVNDSSSATTNIVIDLADIVYGIPLGSDSTKSLLWIQNGKKVEKILADISILLLEDWSVTGTSTTTTTTTTTTGA